MKSFFSALLDWDFFFLGILAERRQLNWRRILLLKSHYSVNVFNTKKRRKLGQNITKAGFQYEPRIIFYFCDLDFIDYYLNFWWYSRKCGQKKFKLWWYSWKAKKKIETTWCPGWALGPPLRLWNPGHKNTRCRARWVDCDWTPKGGTGGFGTYKNFCMSVRRSLRFFVP